MDNLDSSRLTELLSAAGAHLKEEGDSAAIVVVGGSTLSLRGWVQRTTQDVDVIAQAVREEGRWNLTSPEPLPEVLMRAVARVARDFGLPEDWLNTTVGAQWQHGLPEGFVEELEWREFGGLWVGFAGRQSLIALKLYAAVDRGPESVHFQDLLALSPGEQEISRAAEWVLTQDAAESFPHLLNEVVQHVRRAARRADPSR